MNAHSVNMLKNLLYKYYFNTVPEFSSGVQTSELSMSELLNIVKIPAIPGIGAIFVWRVVFKIEVPDDCWGLVCDPIEASKAETQ